jgi:hypothetical protein
MIAPKDKLFELINGLVAIVYAAVAHMPEKQRNAIAGNLRSFLREMSEEEKRSGTGLIIEKFLSAMDSPSPFPPKVLH